LRALDGRSRLSSTDAQTQGCESGPGEASIVGRRGARSSSLCRTRPSRQLVRMEHNCGHAYLGYRPVDRRREAARISGLGAAAVACAKGVVGP
jgi:hypothetical protein